MDNCKKKPQYSNILRCHFTADICVILRMNQDFLQPDFMHRPIFSQYGNKWFINQIKPNQLFPSFRQINPSSCE